MKYYFVTLFVLVEGYEKRINCLVKAESEESASRQAIETDCNGEIEWNSNSISATDSATGMEYSVSEVVLVKPEYLDVLKQYL